MKKAEKCLHFNILNEMSVKQRLWHSCFPVKFAKFLRTPFFTEHLWTTASVYHYDGYYILMWF